jgi:hypothetical protein
LPRDRILPQPLRTKVRANGQQKANDHDVAVHVLFSIERGDSFLPTLGLRPTFKVKSFTRHVCFLHPAASQRDFTFWRVYPPCCTLWRAGLRLVM